MKKILGVILVMLILPSCDKESEGDKETNLLFGKWELKRVEEELSRIESFNKVIFDNNNYDIKPYCDSKISVVLRTTLDDVNFCDLENNSDCITYVDSKKFIEISERGFVMESVRYLEDYYSKNTKQHAGHGLLGDNDCFIKVIQNSIYEEKGEFEILEETNNLTVFYEYEGYKSSEVSSEGYVDGQDDESITYKKGEKTINYSYSINDDGLLVLKFTYEDYYIFNTTWYLNKVE